MISIRRLIASMLAGALLVLVSAAQASAQPAPDFDSAVEGVALGLAAAAELSGDGDVIVLDEGLIKSLEAIDAWFEKHGGTSSDGTVHDGTSNRQGQGQGPVNAQAVHEMLLDGQIPGQLDKDSGSKLSELSGAYEMLKGKSDEAKAAKDAKDKANNGKSDDKSNNGRSDDNSDDGKSDASSKESSKGQPNRP